MTASPLLFDRDLLKVRLDRAAPDYASADFLKRRVAQDVVMRLETILRRFPVAVDLGSRNGAFSEALAESDAAANIDVLFQTDLSARMLGVGNGLKVVADEERLPFGDATLDLAVSTLSLHWTNDLVGALIQIRRALRPDGLFIGAIFGGATLTELRQALLQAEDEVSGGASFRVSPFADAIDAAGLLQRAGFALPVADVDRVKVRYGHPIELLRDLRRMGETSVLLDRSRKPMSRRVLARAMELYVERFAEADGRVPATFEIVAVTGWAPHESQQKPLRPGSAKMRLADALGVQEQSAGEKPV
ncbi:MAG: SAM-dependent methyltransferase [Caulobacter sp. 12-67-6]|nr:MAG: SAM-dependent methyltransferase [Caulobacter sp. 12-67-6]OYX71803.1 MAG: SAM-dependent methyltransferase [Caulobacter sp. 32-67-35]